MKSETIFSIGIAHWSKWPSQILPIVNRKNGLAFYFLGTQKSVKGMGEMINPFRPIIATLETLTNFDGDEV